MLLKSIHYIEYFSTNLLLKSDSSIILLKIKSNLHECINLLNYQLRNKKRNKNLKLYRNFKP